MISHHIKAKSKYSRTKYQLEIGEFALLKKFYSYAVQFTSWKVDSRKEELYINTRNGYKNILGLREGYYYGTLPP